MTRSESESLPRCGSAGQIRGSSLARRCRSKKASPKPAGFGLACIYRIPGSPWTSAQSVAARDSNWPHHKSAPATAPQSGKGAAGGGPIQQAPVDHMHRICHIVGAVCIGVTGFCTGATGSRQVQFLKHPDAVRDIDATVAVAVAPHERRIEDWLHRDGSIVKCRSQGRSIDHDDTLDRRRPERVIPGQVCSCRDL